MINNVMFIGSKQFGLDTLKTINEITPKLIKTIITLDDNNDLRSIKSEFIKYAQTHNINIIFSTSKSETHQIVKKYSPDLCFVNGWYQLFDGEVLRLSKYGFIGIHHSLLPKYRGGSPLVWQLLKGEKLLGSTLFHMDEGTDSGDIIAQVQIENDNLYIAEAREKLERLMINQLQKVWPSIIANTHLRILQNHKEATYCKQLSPEDGLINWSVSAKKIHQKIRAQSLPYPCAFSFYQKKKIKIVEADITKKIISGTPGVISSTDEETGYPIVNCGADGIILKKILLDDLEASPTRIFSTGFFFSDH